jgi:hypothetical protein
MRGAKPALRCSAPKCVEEDSERATVRCYAPRCVADYTRALVEEDSRPELVHEVWNDNDVAERALRCATYIKTIKRRFPYAPRNDLKTWCQQHAGRDAWADFCGMEMIVGREDLYWPLWVLHWTKTGLDVAAVRTRLHTYGENPGDYLGPLGP